MESLFDTPVTHKIIERINKLSPGTKPLWGKMRVEQMLAHSQTPLHIALGEKKFKGGLMAFLFGKIGKRQLVKDEPFKKNLPTAPSFIVRDNRNFEEERNRLIELVNRFSKEPTQDLDTRPHPFFGHLTAEEWNTLQWKHLDHHLRQFGV